MRTQREFAAVFTTVTLSKATAVGGLFLSSAICIIVTPEMLSAARNVMVTGRLSAANTVADSGIKRAPVKARANSLYAFFMSNYLAAANVRTGEIASRIMSSK